MITESGEKIHPPKYQFFNAMHLEPGPDGRVPAAKMTALQQAVLMHIYGRTDTLGQDAFPGNKTVADGLGCSVKTVARILGGFVEQGILVRTDPGGRGPRSPAHYSLGSFAIFNGETPAAEPEPEPEPEPGLVEVVAVEPEPEHAEPEPPIDSEAVEGVPAEILADFRKDQQSKRGFSDQVKGWIDGDEDRYETLKRLAREAETAKAPEAPKASTVQEVPASIHALLDEGIRGRNLATDPAVVAWFIEHHGQHRQARRDALKAEVARRRNAA